MKKAVKKKTKSAKATKAPKSLIKKATKAVANLKAKAKSVIPKALKAAPMPKAAAKTSVKAAGTKAGVTKPAPKELSKNTAKEVSKEESTETVKTAKAGDKSKSHLTKAEKKAEITAALIAASKIEPEVVLTNADGKEYCRVHDCDNEATTDGHCRFHYLALWKRNRVKAKILIGGKLDKYIEDLTSKYPDKYLEMLRKDLSSEKDFNLIIAEMDLEDSGDDAESEEETSRFVEEIRGGVPTTDDDDGGF